MIHGLIHTHSFATLITLNDGEISADHLPFVLHSDQTEKGSLHCHISKGNPLWSNLKSAENILVIFQGPDHYISPNWYPSKQEHHKEVPTWNYAVVHAYGNLQIIEDPQWILNHLNDLTNKHESTQDVPWKVSDAPQKYIAQQINGIVGIEIEITRIEGKWKASQNKKDADKRGVVAALDDVDTPDARGIASIIRNTID